MKRLWCWIVGHDWVVKRTNLGRVAALCNLSFLAGKEADCAWCGEHWDDFNPNGEELVKVDCP